MPSKGEKGPLSLKAVVSSSKLNLGDREAMSKVETSVQVRVGGGRQEFGVVLVDSLDVGVFFDGGCVDLEGFVVIPDLLDLSLNVDQGIALGGLFFLTESEQSKKRELSLSTKKKPVAYSFFHRKQSMFLVGGSSA